MEILCCDDASSDNTRDVAQKAGAEVITWRGNSGGPNKGRNIGLERATGEYICFLDQDDQWLPHKLLLQEKCCRLHSVPICFTEFMIVGKDYVDIIGKRERIAVKEPRNELFLKMLRRDKRYWDALCNVSSTMIHRSLGHIWFEEKFGFADYDYYLQLLEGQETGYVSEILVQRNVGYNNLSLNGYYRAVDYHYNNLVLETYYDNYPDEVEKGKRNLSGTLARYFYLSNNMRRARYYFRRAGFNWKIIAYYLTSYLGHKWVKRNFRIFGT